MSRLSNIDPSAALAVLPMGSGVGMPLATLVRIALGLIACPNAEIALRARWRGERIIASRDRVLGL